MTPLEVAQVAKALWMLAAVVVGLSWVLAAAWAVKH